MWYIREAVEVVLLLARGIYELVTEVEDYAELEARLFRLVQEVTCRLLGACYERIDEQLMRERDRKRLKVVHFKERTLVTPFGELRIKRRYYRDVETGKGRFLLDEALGLKPRSRLSPLLVALAIRIAVELPYHRTASLLADITLRTVEISHMEVWEACQEAGAVTERMAEGRRRAIFELGEVPAGGRQVDRLYVEGDDVSIPGRPVEGKRRRISVKLAVGYEGKEQVAKDRKALANRRVVAGVVDGPTFWEQTVADFAGTWDTSSRKFT